MSDTSDAGPSSPPAAVSSTTTLRETLHDLLLGGIAGVVCRFPTHPLDTCKTVAFACDKESPSFSRAAATIWQREGVRGMYRGVGIAVVGAFPGNALYFVAYESAKKQADTHLSFMPSAVCHLGSGFFAEAVSCCVWVPVDVIKERLQSQAPTVAGRYQSSLDGFRTCMRHEGMRGLYKGYFSTLASFGPFSAVYFTCYEVYGRWLEPVGMGAFAHGLCAALLGNVTSAIITNPLELVKTRLQIQRPALEVGGAGKAASFTNVHGYQYRGIVDGLRSMVRIHGITGMWRGALARAIHTGPNAALAMGTFRWLQEQFPLDSKKK